MKKVLIQMTNYFKKLEYHKLSKIAYFFVLVLLVTYYIPLYNNIEASPKNLTTLITENAKETKNIINAMKVKNTSFRIQNKYNYNTNKKLYLYYSKESTLDYYDIRLRINSTSMYLKDIDKKETNDYIIFSLENISLNPYEIKDYFISFIYESENNKNKDIIYNFVVDN